MTGTCKYKCSVKSLQIALKCKVSYYVSTLDSGIDVGPEMNVGPGKFGKKYKRRA